jgi:signal peptidase II
MRDTINIKTDFKIDKRILKYIYITLIILIIDQIIKVTVYNSLNLHEEIKLIGNWFRIRLELNDGTSFSVPFKNETDRFVKILIKFLLSIVLVLCLIYFSNKKASKILLVGLALCIAGTIGNLIDRTLHGAILENSLDKYDSAWFHGRIIDMFYVPIIDMNLPNWVPFRGGERFLFFEPVFNLADLVLFLGGVMAFSGLIKNSKLKNIKKQ